MSLADSQRLIQRSAISTVASLFSAQARRYPDRIAITDADQQRQYSYGELEQRSQRLADFFQSQDVKHGSRVAILAENRLEYLEVFIAAAKLGAIVACQNWRLAKPELEHCLQLVDPSLILVSPRFQQTLSAIENIKTTHLVFGEEYEQILAAANAEPMLAKVDLDPEDPLLILYTSGTTGLPKGAVLSHRAEIIRNMVVRADFGIAAEDTFVAWPPLYHMGGAELALGTLLSGGKVIIVDGFDQQRLAEIIASESLGWLILMPGMVSRLIDELRRRNITARGVQVCGVMANLVPPAEIAEISKLLNAPYANTFGATETGCPPSAANFLPIGIAPTNLAKKQSPFCEVKLVDSDDNEVSIGTPGELCMRGPTLFSGYWQAPEVNAKDFRGGWFHMGDVFVRNADGTLDFVDRVKYMIKSGGENIYPAEIERVMLQDSRVADAAVVRRADQHWGEVPIAFVARRDESLTKDDLYTRCRQQLAGYKQPKGIHFIALEEFPRSASGKIQHHELENHPLLQLQH